MKTTEVGGEVEGETVEEEEAETEGGVDGGDVSPLEWQGATSGYPTARFLDSLHRITGGSELRRLVALMAVGKVSKVKFISVIA